MKTIQLQEGKKVYFVSDHHFGAPNHSKSRERERHFVQWLDEIKKDAQELFIVGDLFDFWFEYQEVVPKGFVRTLGKLAELSDQGINLHFFVGNHDMWMRDYLTQETGVKIYYRPQEIQINGKPFFIGHGDGLGPGDHGYKFLKKVFRNSVCKFLFRWLHPDIGVWLGRKLSLNNKLISGEEDVNFLGEEKEWLIQFSKEHYSQKLMKYYIFGHRHLPMIVNHKETQIINLGDWIQYYTYASFDGKQFDLNSTNPNLDIPVYSA